MPLPPETLNNIEERLKKAKEIYKDLKPEIDRAKAAGIDVTQQMKQLAELEEQIRKLEIAYIKGKK